MCLFPAQALPTAEANPTHNLAYCAFMRFCPQLAVRSPAEWQRQRDTAAATVNTLYGTFASPFPCLPFRPFTRQLSYPLPAQPERPYPITLHCHTRTLSPSSRSTVGERERAPSCAGIRGTPFVPRSVVALLLFYCHFARTKRRSRWLCWLWEVHTDTDKHTLTHTYSFSIETQHSLGCVHAIPLAVTTHFFGNITLSLFAKLDQL